MTEQAEKSFKEWAKSSKTDLKKRGCRSIAEGVKIIYCDGYEQGRRDEFQDCLKTTDWIDEKFKELDTERLDLLAQLAGKN